MPQVVSVKTVNQRGRVAPNSKPLQRAKTAAQQTGGNKKSLASKAQKLAAVNDKPLGKNAFENAKTRALLGKNVTTISTHVTTGAAAKHKPLGVTNKRTGAALPTTSTKRPRNVELFSSGNFFSVHGLGGNPVQTGNRSHPSSQFPLDAPCVGENGKIYFSNTSAKTPEWCVEATLSAYIYAMMQAVDLAARKHVFAPGLCYLPLSVAVEMMKTTVLGSYNKMNNVCEAIMKKKIDEAVNTTEDTVTNNADLTSDEIELFEKTEFFHAFAHCDVHKVVKRVANRPDMKHFLRHSSHNKDDPFIPFWAIDQYFDEGAWKAFKKQFPGDAITIKTFTEEAYTDTTKETLIQKMRALYSPLTPKFLKELAISMTSEDPVDPKHTLKVEKETVPDGTGENTVEELVKEDYFADILTGRTDFENMRKEQAALIESTLENKKFYNQAPSKEDLRYSVAIALTHVHEMSFKNILSFIMKTAYNLKSTYKSDKPNPDIRSVLANAATYELYKLITKDTGAATEAATGAGMFPGYAKILMEQVLSACYSEKGLAYFKEDKIKSNVIDCTEIKKNHEAIFAKHMELANKSYNDLESLRKADDSDDDFQKMVTSMYNVAINKEILTTNGVIDDLAEVKQKMKDWFKNARTIYPTSFQSSSNGSLNAPNLSLNNLLEKKLNHFRRHFTVHQQCTQGINKAAERLLRLQRPEISKFFKTMQASSMTTLYILGIRHELFKDVLFHVHFAGAYVKTHYNSLTSDDIKTFREDLLLLKSATVADLKETDVVHLYETFNKDSFQDYRSTLKKFFKFCIEVLANGKFNIFDPTKTPVIELIPVVQNTRSRYDFVSNVGGIPSGGGSQVAIGNGGSQPVQQPRYTPPPTGDIEMKDLLAQLRQRQEELQLVMDRVDPDETTSTAEAGGDTPTKRKIREDERANAAREIEKLQQQIADLEAGHGTSMPALPSIDFHGTKVSSFACVFQRNMGAHTNSPNFNSQKYFSGGLTTSRIAKLVPTAAERLKSDKAHMLECKRQVDSVRQMYSQHTRFAIGKFCRAKTAAVRASEPQLPLLTNSSNVLLNSLRVASSVASTREQFADLFI